jgi:hypothetical protein
MEAKEKVKDLNQMFLTLINKIPLASKPTDDVSIEFYTSSLSVSMVNFVKRTEKGTMEDTFKEAIKVDKGILILKGNLGAEVSKDKSNTKSKVTLKKNPEDKKYQESMDMEALKRIVKNIYNEIIDMNKRTREGTSNAKKVFKFSPKKIIPTIKTSPPTEGVNMEDFIKEFKSWENDTYTYQK